MGQGQLGIKTQGLGILGLSLIQLPLCRQGQPQVVMGQGQAGIRRRASAYWASA